MSAKQLAVGTSFGLLSGIEKGLMHWKHFTLFLESSLPCAARWASVGVQFVLTEGSGSTIANK